MALMDRKQSGAPPADKPTSEADRRMARRAVALRANLRRRKEQERGRVDSEAPVEGRKSDR